MESLMLHEDKSSYVQAITNRTLKHFNCSQVNPLWSTITTVNCFGSTVNQKILNYHVFLQQQNLIPSRISASVTRWLCEVLTVQSYHCCTNFQQRIADKTVTHSCRTGFTQAVRNTSFVSKYRRDMEFVSLPLMDLMQHWNGTYLQKNAVKRLRTVQDQINPLF